MRPTLPDGLVAVVKRDCPTCQLVVPVLEELAQTDPLTIYTQDDPTFPEGLDPIDDTALTTSFALDLDTVPTVLRVESGREVARIVGWSRDEWEAFTGRSGLGAGLPPHRPGCGSKTQDPDIAAARSAAHGATQLRSRRIELGTHEDEMEAMFERGWSDGLPLVPPTPERVAHLLTMYGFIFYVGSTVALVFWYSTRGSATPAILPLLWHLGALMICIGGYWFWFFIRADVAAEGQSPFRVVRADLFVLSLLGSATMALVWSYLQWSGHPLANVALVLCLIATVVLFGSVPWSKFSHMFFKPAAAYQKRLIKADGSRENLPRTYDLTDPAVQRQFPDIPEYMGKNPPDMGLGIKREAPRHY